MKFPVAVTKGVTGGIGIEFRSRGAQPGLPVMGKSEAVLAQPPKWAFIVALPVKDLVPWLVELLGEAGLTENTVDPDFVSDRSGG